MQQRYLITRFGLIIFDLQILDHLSDFRISIGDKLYISIFLLGKYLIYIRDICQIPVFIKQLLERQSLFGYIAYITRDYVYIIFGLDIYIRQIKLLEFVQEISIRKESEIILGFDSDVDNLIQFCLDKPISYIFGKSGNDLIHLRIISCPIKGGIARGDNAATIIEKLWCYRQYLFVSEYLHIFDAIQ